MVESKAINRIFSPDVFIIIFNFLYGAKLPEVGSLGAESDVEMGGHFRRHPLLDEMLVCRDWHRVIEGTPRYWTTINLGAGGRVGWGTKPPSNDPDLLEKVLEQVIGKSGGVPIQVNVTPARLQNFDKVAQALHKHVQRIRILNVLPCHQDDEVNEQLIGNQLGQLLDCPFPNLERFGVGPLHIVPNPDDPATSSPNVTLVAPQLRTLRCEGHSIFPHPASRLTSLHLKDILQLTYPQGTDTIELPQLLDLYLQDSDPAWLLPHLSTPMLEKAESSVQLYGIFSKH